MFHEIKASLRQLYLEDARPWLVGFSGGKDSTMLASLILDVVISIPAEQRKKPISVLCTDTRVEIPAIAEMIEGTLDRMRKCSDQNGLNIDANLLSIGAIDFGIIIDGTVVMVENIYRELGLRHGTVYKLQEVIIAAARIVDRQKGIIMNADLGELSRLREMEDQIAAEKGINVETLRRMVAKVEEYSESHRARGLPGDLPNILKDDLESRPRLT
jgi:hypothetical protein